MNQLYTGRALRTALVSSIIALSHTPALAQTYGGVPASGATPVTSRPGGFSPASAPSRSSPSGSRSSGPAEPPVHFVATIGYDIGSSTKLIEVQSTDGSTHSLKANQGLDLSVGLSFLKFFEGTLATQATIGLETRSITASNGSLQWMAFPLDVMEYAYLDPIRLGVGISYLLNPSLSGSGIASGVTANYKNSLGFAVGGDIVSVFSSSARRSRVTLGVRYVWQTLKQTSGSWWEYEDGKAKANSLAITCGFVL